MIFAGTIHLAHSYYVLMDMLSALLMVIIMIPGIPAARFLFTTGQKIDIMAGDRMACENCMMEQRIAALEKDMEKNSVQHGEFYKRFGNLESFQARTDEKYTNIMREIEKMSETLEELKSAPARNWNAVVSAAISGIVGAVIGFLMRGGI